MGLKLDRIFDALTPVRVAAGQTAYSVARVPRFPAYLVGRDSDGKACLLIDIAEPQSRQRAPIRLQNVQVEFEVRSHVTEHSRKSEGTFTVVRCRSNDAEIIRYFFSVAETMLRVLGLHPRQEEIANAIAHLARIFQKLETAPARPVIGLFGELFLIARCRNPVRALMCWRLQDASRYDFTAGDLRLDVKAASGRARIHTFSYDQCNPPAGTRAFVASLFAEHTPTGVSLAEIIQEIEAFISGRTELLIKLQETVATTLGNGLQEAVKARFDDKLAASSLRFFELRSIPAIRGTLPPGVSDVHFRSDLSSSTDASIGFLIEQEPAIEDFLP